MTVNSHNSWARDTGASAVMPCIHILYKQSIAKQLALATKCQINAWQTAGDR